MQFICQSRCIDNRAFEKGLIYKSVALHEHVAIMQHNSKNGGINL